MQVRIKNEITWLFLNEFPEILTEFCPLLCLLQKWRHIVFAIGVRSLSVKKPCPLRNLNTIWDILMKLHTNVKEDKTMCRAQKNGNPGLHIFRIIAL